MRVPETCNFFCHCCDCTCNNLHVPNDNFCMSCEEFLTLHPDCRSDWSCSCHKLITTDLKESVRQDRNHFIAQVKTGCDSASRQSKLLLTKHDDVESKSVPCSIDCAWSTCAERRTHMNFLFNEATLRDINVTGKV